jgi:hypothetical protein
VIVYGFQSRVEIDGECYQIPILTSRETLIPPLFSGIPLSSIDMPFASYTDTRQVFQNSQSPAMMRVPALDDFIIATSYNS